MKAVILAGGLGSRLAEETQLKPKPMVDIGGRPILWHIMKLYHAHGIRDFIICCGFKGYVIKEYFANYALHMSDMTFDMAQNTLHFHKQKAEDWRVTLVDTGDDTLTGGRLKRIAPYLDDEQDFCFTYGDGVTNLDISATIAFHKGHGKLATITAVHPPARFGALKLDGDRVEGFIEKPEGEGGYINGGFFVLSRDVLNHIEGDRTSFESTPLIALAEANQLRAFFHRGFWQPMDTLRDKNTLQALWDGGSAPWKCW